MGVKKVEEVKEYVGNLDIKEVKHDSAKILVEIGDERFFYDGISGSIVFDLGRRLYAYGFVNEKRDMIDTFKELLELGVIYIPDEIIDKIEKSEKLRKLISYVAFNSWEKENSIRKLDMMECLSSLSEKDLEKFVKDKSLDDIGRKVSDAMKLFGVFESNTGEINDDIDRTVRRIYQNRNNLKRKITIDPKENLPLNKLEKVRNKVFKSSNIEDLKTEVKEYMKTVEDFMREPTMILSDAKITISYINKSGSNGYVDGELDNVTFGSRREWISCGK